MSILEEFTVVTGIALAACVLCASVLLTLINRPTRWSALAVAAGLAFVVILNEALRHDARIGLLIALMLGLTALIAGLSIVIEWIAGALQQQSGTVEPEEIRKQAQPL